MTNTTFVNLLFCYDYIDLEESISIKSALRIYGINKVTIDKDTELSHALRTMFSFTFAQERLNLSKGYFATICNRLPKGLSIRDMVEKVKEIKYIKPLNFDY